jgi:sarcosine oxidase subunit beta
MARYMATGECPERLRPFRLRRYQEHRMMGETATPVDYSPWN